MHTLRCCYCCCSRMLFSFFVKETELRVSRSLVRVVVSFLLMVHTCTVCSLFVRRVCLCVDVRVCVPACLLGFPCTETCDGALFFPHTFPIPFCRSQTTSRREKQRHYKTNQTSNNEQRQTIFNFMSNKTNLIE